MTDFQNWLEALANVPLYLQILVGIGILNLIITTTLGCVIAWQVSNVARAIRESGHRPAPPTQTPPQPPTNFGRPDYGPYPPRS